MTGEYEHSIDAKGRLFIPAKLREKLGPTFYVTISMDKCLGAYPIETWDRIKTQYDALPLSKARKVKRLFTNAACCELDAQGRILLPAKLRAFAGITKNVTVVGVSNHAEIWDTDEWNKTESEELTPENIAAAMEELGF